MTPLQKAAQDAAEEIESLSLEWKTSYLPREQAERIILRHLAPIEAELAELQQIKAILKDPAAVWVNMLRGEIARPQALDHYEECKQRVEQLEAELPRWEKIENVKRDNTDALGRYRTPDGVFHYSVFRCDFEGIIWDWIWTHPPTHFMRIPKGPGE